MNLEEKKRELVLREWDLFQKVQNEGGRASCQNNFPVFSLMRSSQFAFWPEALVDSYLTDLKTAAQQGRNLLSEKYAWMMEHTAPEAFAQIKGQLPVLSTEVSTLVAEIVSYHLEWMMAYCKKYPHLAATNRATTSDKDTVVATSFQTYLEGELKTYSLTTLRLYRDFMIELYQEGRNLALLTMENTVKGYGYASLDEAEQSFVAQKEKGSTKKGSTKMR